jgi:phosphatidyl-myo-inositol dimannoside synthase
MIRGNPRPSMNPLFFISHLFSPTVGGSIRWTEQLCHDYRGGGVSVLTRDIGKIQDPESDSIRVRRVPLRIIPWLRPESLLLYRKFCSAGLHVARKEKPAIVAAAGVAPDGMVAMHLKRRLGIPYVVLAHGEEITLPVHSRGRPVTRTMKLAAMRRVFRNADRVIVNSANTADTVHDFAGSQVSTRTLHPGADLDFFAPAGPNLRRELGLGARPVILTVGHLMHRKGQGKVLEALPRVLRQVPGAIYLMAGTGVDEASMRHTAKQCGIEDSVRFLGHVPEEKLPLLYRTAYLFVLANRNLPNGDFEGFGIVFVEASASGLPVIVGAPAGNADAVVDDVTALRVDPESPADIAGTILRILTNPSLADQMGRAGREFAIGNFAPQLLADRWNEILEEVLSQPESTAAVLRPARRKGRPAATTPARTTEHSV